MAQVEIRLDKKHPGTVGSFGNADILSGTSAFDVLQSCDIAEIRLDLLFAEKGTIDPLPWRHLEVVPLLFTARRIEEGGAVLLDADRRSGLLSMALEHAAMIDIEVASIQEMAEIIREIEARNIPWIASFHDFEKLPSPGAMAEAAALAKASGAAAFKIAAMLHGPADVARLAEFQQADHGLPVATMGMGALAPVSRLLCAQCGSVLNYGYLRETPTAPGQWDAAFLRQAISRLASIDPPA